MNLDIKQFEDAKIIANKIADNFTSRQITGSDYYGNKYEVELTYEALIGLGLKLDSIKTYLETEGMLNPALAKNWIYQEFHDAAYPWFEYQNQLADFKAAYLEVTDNWINDTVRRESGTIVYHGPQVLLGSLIDMLQAYMIRLCRASILANDKVYAEEAVNQYRLYVAELRNSISGCFHQGKGWLENDGISPSPWSRGQGWLAHGLIHCIPLLKQWPDLHEEIKNYFVGFMEDLIHFQTEAGCWNQLIDRPDESFPDTSGSALIVEALVLGVKNEYLKDEKFYNSAIKAWVFLKQQVDDEGFVDQACKGPGTIWKVEPWLNTKAPKGEPHGIFTMLFACKAILQ